MHSPRREDIRTLRDAAGGLAGVSDGLSEAVGTVLDSLGRLADLVGPLPL